MTIRALIFDFDGLILDTETPDVEVWRAIYAEHGQAYPIERWSQIIGGWGNSDFDPADALQDLVGKPLDLRALRERYRRESDAMILRAPVLEGVREILAAARRLGLRCAVASSSELGWVKPHLERLGLRDQFETITTGDDVPSGRTKPHPDVYLKALEALQLGAGEVLALEDSPNGARAARAAGLRVVGVPNPVTAPLRIEADLLLRSLKDLSLEEILQRIDGVQGATGAVRRLPEIADPG
jgi:HAD superfamily hydrolase (TIGR01509 family)